MGPTFPSPSSVPFVLSRLLSPLSHARSDIRHAHRNVGMPPGSVVFAGEAPSEPVEVTVTDYAEDHLAEKTVDPSVLPPMYRTPATTTWIQASGIHDVDVIRTLGSYFGLHPLVQEDIANVHQRPKLEAFDDYVYIVVKQIDVDADGTNGRAQQISLIVGDGYVLSFQESGRAPFDVVRKRIRNGRGRIRNEGADYLAYALLDVVVDQYFVALDAFATRTEALEDDILEPPTNDTQEELNALRRDLVFVRRMTSPIRDVLSQLERIDAPFWKDTTRPFVRDVHDHAVQVLDLLESMRDVVNGLTDLYMTTLSNRMNEIMKVLTIIGTIFIPLTFVAGIYGMNFSYMPELNHPYGYPIAMAVMVGIAVVLLVYFRRRDWI